MAVVLNVTDALVGVIDELAGLDPLCLTDGDTVQALHRQLERLGAVTTRAVAGFDAGRAWEADGARTVGVRRRIFTGATRRGVEVRDRACFHPSCETPAQDCEIDHVVPWSEGGSTTEDNGRVAGGFHNRERHRPPPSPP